MAIISLKRAFLDIRYAFIDIAKAIADIILGRINKLIKGLLDYFENKIILWAAI